SSIAFLLLMIVSGLPIYSLVFLYGGVSPSQLLFIFLFYLLTLLALASIGVMFSTLIRKTIVAIIATYGAMIFFAGVTAFFLLISVQVSQMGTAAPSMSPMAHFWATINPPAVLLTLLQPTMEGQLQSLTMISVPLWIGYTIFYILLTVFCIFMAVKKLRVNMNKYK